MKFSIIVPVYNIEKFIDKCVQSIISQKYKNFELIIVDDGSKDESGLICDKYQIKYPSLIKVVHQKNSGLSEARNTGILNSSGDYLMFVDGDDFLYNENILYDINKVLIMYQYDIFQYNMVYYYENKDLYVKLKDLKELRSDSGIIDILFELNNTNQISISACDKVVKTSLIKNNNLLFKKGIQSEDIDWSLRVYLNANSIYTANNYYYVYRQQRLGSITSKTSKKNMIDLYNIINYWYQYNYPNDNFKKLYYNYISYQYLILITKSNRKMFSIDQNEIINSMKKELLQYDQSAKVRLFNRFKNVLGFRLSLLLMKIYLKLKNKGFIKI